MRYYLVLPAVLLLAATLAPSAFAAGFGVPEGPLDPSGYFILTGPDIQQLTMDWGDTRHFIDFYIEVTGFSLTVGIYDPGLISATPENLDLYFSGTIGSVTYTLDDPSGATIAQETYQSDTEGATGTNLNLVTLYDGSAEPGLYHLNVTMDDTTETDEDINAFGVSVPGYNFYSYYFTGGESNLAGASITEPLTLYPLVLHSTPGIFEDNDITGVDTLNGDMDSADNDPPPDIRIETPSNRGADLQPSQDNQLFTTNLRGIDVDNMDGTDYGIWELRVTNLDHVMEGANDLNIFTFQICDYESGIQAEDFPVLPGDPGNPVRLYYPGEAGFPPVKETMVHHARVVSGPDPPLVGGTTVIEVTLEIRNRTGYNLTGIDVMTYTSRNFQFSNPVITCTSGGLGASAFVRDINVTGDVAAGQTGTVRYNVTLTPAIAGLLYITGDESDLQGGSLPTEGSYHTPFTQPPEEERLGPIHMLRIEAQEADCAITASIQGELDICGGDELSLSAAGSTVTGCPGEPEYRWLRDGDELHPFPGPSSISDYPEEQTDYSVEVRCSVLPLCSDSTEVTVIVRPGVLADAGSDDITCERIGIPIGGSPTASGGTGALSCHWEPEQDLDDPFSCNPILTPSGPATPLTYTVTVSDENDCDATSSVRIEVIPDIPPDPVGNTLFLIREGNDIRFIWTTNGSYSYNLRRHDLKSFPRPTSELLATETAGEYLAADEVSLSPHPVSHYRVFSVNCSGSEEE